MKALPGLLITTANVEEGRYVVHVVNVLFNEKLFGSNRPLQR